MNFINQEQKQFKLKFIMKKLLLLVAVPFLFAATRMNAQEKGDMAAGAYIAIGAGDSFTNYGLGAKFQWNVIDHLRLEPSMTYFVKKDDLSMWNLDANVHYQFVLDDIFTLYPLAGMGLVGVRYNEKPHDTLPEEHFAFSDSEFVFNIGGGADFDITEKIMLNLEAKYKVGTDDFNRFIFSMGVAYKF